MTTFQALYDSRCVKKGEKLVPVFWKPQPIEAAPLTLFADDTCPVLPEWGCDAAIMRIIALGLCCEIPVGEFVKNANRDLTDPILPALLRSHVADEAVHDLGFRLAADAYPVSDDIAAEALDIADKWRSIAIHPIVPAAALEVGVFLTSLGAMRLFGGNSLSHMAAQIAKDEYRHVAVNMAVMQGMGLDFTGEILALIDSTVAWIFQGLNIPESETSILVDCDFFVRASCELVTTGSAQDLDDLVNYTDYTAAFEVPNASLYSRSV
jgi:hypothetical protein